MKKKVYKVVGNNYKDFNNKYEYKIGKSINSKEGFHYSENIIDTFSYNRIVHPKDHINGLQRYLEIEIEVSNRTHCITEDNIAYTGIVLRELNAKDLYDLLLQEPIINWNVMYNHTKFGNELKKLNNKRIKGEKNDR